MLMNKFFGFFKDIYAIFAKELYKISHDKNLFLMFLFAPFVYPFMYGGIYMEKIEENVPCAFIDYDNSSASRQLLRCLDAHQEIYLKYRMTDIHKAKEMMVHDKFQALIIIPHDFSLNLKRGKETNVNCILSAGRLLVTSDVGFAVSGIVSTFGTQIAASFLSKNGVPVFTNSDAAVPIRSDFQYLYNPYVTYGDYLLPAIMLTIFSQLLFIGVGASTAHEYTIDKWKGVFEITHNYLAIFIGKIATYVGLFVFFSLFTFSITCSVYQIRVTTNLMQFAFVMILGITASATLGMFLGTFIRRKVTAFVLLGFMTYPFFFMSCYGWTPMDIPLGYQIFADFFPLPPFLTSLFKVSQMGRPLSFAINEILILCGQILVYGGLCMVRFRTLCLNKKPKNNFEEYWFQLPR